MNILQIILAVLPGIVISYLIYRWDLYEKESKLLLAGAFVLGILTCFPAMQLEIWGDNAGFNENSGFGNLVFLSYVVVGTSEELVKFLVLMLFAYPRKEFNEPLDGIVYAVMIGMGFATLENILYTDTYGMGTTLVRAFTAVPAHAIFAIIMGYFVGLAKFDRFTRWQKLALGLGIPILVHGTYDIFILQQYYDWLMLLATVTLIVSGYFSYRLIRLHQQNSPFNKELAIESFPVNPIPPIETTPKLTEDDIMDAVLKEMEEEE